MERKVVLLADDNADDRGVTPPALERPRAIRAGVACGEEARDRPLARGAGGRLPPVPSNSACAWRRWNGLNSRSACAMSKPAPLSVTW